VISYFWQNHPKLGSRFVYEVQFGDGGRDPSAAQNDKRFYRSLTSDEWPLFYDLDKDLRDDEF
jgi:hypothetical protein